MNNKNYYLKIKLYKTI